MPNVTYKNIAGKVVILMNVPVGSNAVNLSERMRLSPIPMGKPF